MNSSIVSNTLNMPAEWEKHEATWLSWPNDDDFFQEKIGNVKKLYVEIISHLHKGEYVKIVVLNQEVEDKVKMLLTEAGVDLSKIIFFQIDYVDVWMRDYSPTFIKKDGKIVWVKWIYDGYNKKFPELLKDGEVFNDLNKVLNSKVTNMDYVMESGAFEVNGAGTFMTTMQCLLENRNKGKTKSDYEKMFSETLGVNNFIWLNKGLFNDHTDGHIDEVARFVSPSKILCAYEENEKDENFEILKENFEILENSLDQDGNKFEVVKLPMPHMFYDDGEKAPVSYANFYIGNEIVLATVFGDPNDDKAIEIIQSCFPDRKVVPINCSELIYGGGAIHCITAQQPLE
jgi:agmatine deiminase